MQNHSQSRGGDGDFVILCCRKSAARLKLNADTLLSLSVNIHPWMPTRLFRAALHCIMPDWSLLAELELQVIAERERTDVDVPSRAQRHLGRLMKDTQPAWLPDWLLRSPSSSWEGKLTQIVQHPPSDGESQESPRGLGPSKIKAGFCMLP